MWIVKEKLSCGRRFIPVHGNSDAIDNKIRLCAKGTYQLNVVLGFQKWSGGDLTGLARHFGAKYKASRDRVWDRLVASFEKVRYVRDWNRRGKAVVLVRESGCWYQVGEQ